MRMGKTSSRSGAGAEILGGTETRRSGRGEDAMARKHTGNKTPAGEGAGKARVSLTLRLDTIERLGVHASMLRRDKGAVADEILRAGLKRFRVADRQKAGPADSEDSADLSDPGLRVG